MSLKQSLKAFFNPSYGTEEVLVMDKSVTIEREGEDNFNKTKIDHLEKNELVTDVEEMKKQRMKDLKEKGMILLPLFKFEEKEKKHLELFIKQLINAAKVERKDHQDNYIDLLRNIKILDYIDVNFLIDLCIIRNKEAYSTIEKVIEVEVVTCFFEKRLRVKYNIQEDIIIDPTIHTEFCQEKERIHNQMLDFYNNISSQVPIDDRLNKDIEVELIKTAGSEDYGYGYAIVVRYLKKIDYSNERRGREALDDPFLFSSIDEDYKQHLLNHFNKYNNTTTIESIEALADGMTDSEGENGDEETSGNLEENIGESGDTAEDEGFNGTDDGPNFDNPEQADDGTSFGNDDTGGGGNDQEGGFGGSGGDDEETGFTKDEEKGDNPFRDKNAQEKTAGELKELLGQIDKVILVMNNLPNTSTSRVNLQKIIGTKLTDLQLMITDALQLSYIQPAENSILRYVMYLNRFNELTQELKVKILNELEEERKEDKKAEQNKGTN
jgi:hypothetical protein